MVKKCSELGFSESLTITEIVAPEDQRLRLYEMGFVPETVISLSAKLPFNGPLAFQCRDSKIAIRAEEAALIQGLVNKN